MSANGTSEGLGAFLGTGCCNCDLFTGISVQALVVTDRALAVSPSVICFSHSYGLTAIPSLAVLVSGLGPLFSAGVVSRIDVDVLCGISVSAFTSISACSFYGTSCRNFYCFGVGMFKNCTSLVITADNGEVELDSYGRHLAWIWYKAEGATEYSLLNLR